MVEWLRHHWFLAGIATTILGAAYAGGAKIVTMEQAIKSNSEVAAKIDKVKENQAEMKAVQSRLDERTLMILDAIKDLKDGSN